MSRKIRKFKHRSDPPVIRANMRGKCREYFAKDPTLLYAWLEHMRIYAFQDVTLPPELEGGTKYELVAGRS